MLRNRLLAPLLLSAFFAAGMVGTPSPAAAQEPPTQKAYPQGKPLDDLGPAMKKEVGRLLSILEMFLQSIPTYEMPEILDNGDIIIRRKHDAPVPTPETPPKGEAPTDDMSRT